MTTMLTSDLPLPRIGRGKVRDIYAVGDDRVLLLTTDRISAFDVVMAETIPMSAVLTQISAWWFEQLEGVVHHHMISADADTIMSEVPAAGPSRLARRPRDACKRTTVFPIECVVRGYSRLGLKEYAQQGTLAGEKLPPACWKAPNWSLRFSARPPRRRPATTRTSRSRGCARCSATR
jgi:phosphoribosylaminoimidazole-succinocarboxamide synthase